jgi:hypothetical protein
MEPIVNQVIEEIKWFKKNRELASGPKLESMLHLFERHLEELRDVLSSSTIDLEQYRKIKSLINSIRFDIESGNDKFIKKLKGELADVVDSNDVPVAVTEGGFTHLFGLRHRTANAFVLCPDGKVVLQRRVHNKAEAKRNASQISRLLSHFGSLARGLPGLRL